MKAIILAAGRGSRMGEMTSCKPKCMLEIAGQSLLSWQLAALRNVEFNEIGIVVGYRADSFMLDNIRIIRNQNWSTSNMVSSLLCADNWIANDDIIVSYSDIFYSSNVVSLLKKTTADIVITYDRNWLNIWKARFDDPLSDAETFKLNSKGMLREIGKHSESIDDIEGQFMGLLKFTRKGWALTKEVLDEFPSNIVSKMDMTSLLSLMLDKGINIDAVPIPTDEGWGELDSEQDLVAYRKLLLENSYSWMNKK